MRAGSARADNAPPGKEDSMRRRFFARRLASLLAALALPLHAQPARPLRLAWVTTERKDMRSPNLEAFRDGLRELGYAEGRSLVIETWSGNGSGERVRQMAGDIVRSRPDIVVAAGGLALFALVGAGVKSPIVFSISADPVEAKLIESYARPGGNVTGISLFTLALVGKRMELTKEILPSMTRIAVIANAQHPGERLELKAAQEAADKLGLALRYFPMNSEADLEVALADIGRAHDDAVIAFADGFTLGFAKRIAAFSIQTRIPAIDGWAPFAEQGNLMIYGPVVGDVYRRLAAFVDKIAKGARPSDLPVELPTKVELVINLVAAQALGITVPASVLARADRVIR
jgi:putative ABC transport system substrate-binding protein